MEILIVEDSPTQALKLRHLLTRHGHRATVARNAWEALSALEAVVPDLVLCDIGLSGVDGYELCRRIKARPDLSGLSVVLLTSFLDPEGAVRALQCGADNWLPRVFEEGTLLSRLDDVLANLDLRRYAPEGAPAEVRLGGVLHRLPPECGSRALDLLLSTYQVAVERSAELRLAREALERQAEARDEPKETTAAPAPPPEPSPSPAPPPRPLRVLLAEDSPVNQRLAVRTLEKRGYQVTAVGDGRQALAAWEASPFDLVLMDVEMPEMDGVAATREIRAREQATGAHIPIVAMTAHDRPEDLERFLAAGMDAHTAKPLRVDVLLEIMQIILPAEAPGG